MVRNCGSYEYYDPVMSMCCSCLNLCHRGFHASDPCKRHCPVYYEEILQAQNDESDPVPEPQMLHADQPTLSSTLFITMENEESMDLGAPAFSFANIVIVILAIMVVFLLVVLLVYCVCRRSRKPKTENDSETGLTCVGKNEDV